MNVVPKESSKTVISWTNKQIQILSENRVNQKWKPDCIRKENTKSCNLRYHYINFSQTT